MYILITGIHGFVGSNMVKAYASQHTLYGLDIVAPEVEGVKKTFSWDDLRQGNLPEVDAIIHLAGKAHDTKNKAKADVYFQINTELTKQIYDYFLASTAKKFVFFSSSKAAADRVEGDVLTEEVQPKPKGPYGESKIAAEQYIFSKEDVRKKEGKSVFVLRPCMIHGPGNKGNLNLLFAVVRRGIPWPLGAFENRRSFTSIDNLTFAVEHLLAGEAASGVYNMCDDEALSTNELITLICTTIGKKPRIWHLSKPFMECVAKIGSVAHLPLNTERLQKLTENYVASNSKIKQAIGVERMPVRAAEGLEQTIKSFELCN